MLINNIDVSPLLKAQIFLENAVKQARSDLEKAGAIQGFEICYELAWKTMKRILAFRGIDVASPRETFRQAALEKLIHDPETWFEFIRKRNMTVHSYNHKIAEEIFHFLPVFASELQHFIDILKTFK